MLPVFQGRDESTQSQDDGCGLTFRLKAEATLTKTLKAEATLTKTTYGQKL
jgi:hypothetical protein